MERSEDLMRRFESVLGKDVVRDVICALEANGNNGAWIAALLAELMKRISKEEESYLSLIELILVSYDFSHIVEIRNEEKRKLLNEFSAFLSGYLLSGKSSVQFFTLLFGSNMCYFIQEVVGTRGYDITVSRNSIDEIKELFSVNLASG